MGPMGRSDALEKLGVVLLVREVLLDALEELQLALRQLFGLLAREPEAGQACTAALPHSYVGEQRYW